MIEAIEEKLGYSYTGFRNGFYRFKKYCNKRDLMIYHAFEKTTCEICGGPYMKRKGNATKGHVGCTTRVTNAVLHAKGLLGRPRLVTV